MITSLKRESEKVDRGESGIYSLKIIFYEEKHKRVERTEGGHRIFKKI